MLLIAVFKFFMLIPSCEEININDLKFEIIDSNKAVRILQWIIGFDALLELIGGLFIIFII